MRHGTRIAAVYLHESVGSNSKSGLTPPSSRAHTAFTDVMEKEIHGEATLTSPR